MALADSVPGVSGGTIAFLLGFYDKFITSVMNKGYYFKDSGGLLRGDLISDTELLDKKKKAANSVILDIMKISLKILIIKSFP